MTCADLIPDDAVATSRKKGDIAAGYTPPRILVADDQEEVRLTVALLLEGEFQIVGLAQNGKEALELVHSLSPNVLVLDIAMPVLNGIETAQQVRVSGSATEVVILTVDEDPDFIEAAISAGAHGYVLKPRIVTDLIPAIRTVLGGHFFASSSVS